MGFCCRTHFKGLSLVKVIVEVQFNIIHQESRQVSRQIGKVKKIQRGGVVGWYGVGSRGAIRICRFEGMTTIDLAEKVPAEREHLSFLYI
jgi:hypothetical protein